MSFYQLKSAYISDLIEKGDIDALKEAIEKGKDDGMQGFDQSLLTLYEQGKISEEDALANADSRNNLALKIRLARGGSRGENSDLSMDP